MLSSTDRVLVSDAFAALERAAEAAADMTSGLDAWARRAWSGLIGASSSASAVDNAAKQTLEAVPRFRTRIEELLSSATATHAQALAFVRDVAPYADVADLVKTASLTSPAGAAKDIGAGVAKDVTSTLLDPLVAGGKTSLGLVGWLLRNLPFILVGVGLLLVLPFVLPWAGRILAAWKRAAREK